MLEASLEKETNEQWSWMSKHGREIAQVSTAAQRGKNSQYRVHKVVSVNTELSFITLFPLLWGICIGFWAGCAMIAAI